MKNDEKHVTGQSGSITCSTPVPPAWRAKRLAFTKKQSEIIDAMTIARDIGLGLGEVKGFGMVAALRLIKRKSIESFDFHGERRYRLAKPE